MTIFPYHFYHGKVVARVSLKRLIFMLSDINLIPNKQAVKITEEMVHNLFDSLRAASIDFVVAPYEADPQMVWLCKSNNVSAIITEDSDLLTYSVAANFSCGILYKLDEHGHAKELSLDILKRATENSEDTFIRNMKFLVDSNENSNIMFIQFCILAGCDFLDSLPKIGVVTAQKHIIAFRGSPPEFRIKRIIAKLKSTGIKVPSEYYKDFCKAELLFCSHIIFNPEKLICEHLTDRLKSLLTTCKKDDLISHIAQKGKHEDFLGTLVPPPIAIKIYNGEISTRSFQQINKRSNNDPVHSNKAGIPCSSANLSSGHDLNLSQAEYASSHVVKHMDCCSTETKVSKTKVINNASDSKPSTENRNLVMSNIMAIYGTSDSRMASEAKMKRSHNVGKSISLLGLVQNNPKHEMVKQNIVCQGSIDTGTSTSARGPTTKKVPFSKIDRCDYTKTPSKKKRKSIQNNSKNQQKTMRHFFS